MNGCCYWKDNEVLNCMKSECGKKCFFPAELVEESRVRRATRRFKMSAARCQKISEETLKEVSDKVLGAEEQPGSSELKKKADLAVEIAELITGCTEDEHGQMKTLSLVAELLFGGFIRVTRVA